MPQVVEAEVLDAGAPLGLLPRCRALLDPLAGEGEAPAWVLTLHRLERRQGVCAGIVSTETKGQPLRDGRSA